MRGGGDCLWRSLSRLARCKRVDSVEVRGFLRGGWGEVEEEGGDVGELGFKGEAWHLKLARLAWKMWRLCAGMVELITCIMMVGAVLCCYECLVES